MPGERGLTETSFARSLGDHQTVESKFSARSHEGNFTPIAASTAVARSQRDRPQGPTPSRATALEWPCCDGILPQSRRPDQRRPRSGCQPVGAPHQFPGRTCQEDSLSESDRGQAEAGIATLRITGPQAIRTRHQYV